MCRRLAALPDCLPDCNLPATMAPRTRLYGTSFPGLALCWILEPKQSILWRRRRRERKVEGWRDGEMVDGRATIYARRSPPVVLGIASTAARLQHMSMPI